MDSISFIDSVHVLGQNTFLTGEFTKVETPSGFKAGVQLYPHQQTVVRAMLDLEDRRSIDVVTDKDYSSMTNMSVKLESSAMLLSEPFGSGKTIEILALILLRPVPRAVPVHMNTVATVFMFANEVVRKFTAPNALIRSNLIIVGSSVLVQWENSIKQFTNLKYYVVGDFYKLREFKKLFQAKKLRQYDIILLKNGKVSGNLFDTQESNNLSLIDAIGSITNGSCWARVIYDDFDTISIPSNTSLLNALFSVFVSATTKHVSNIRSNNKYDLARLKVNLHDIVGDRYLRTNFNVANNREFVRDSIEIPFINGYKYVYTNPNDNYIRLIGSMCAEEANNVMEMLNGDAIHTAAEAVGIKSVSVADIFQRMLDVKYENYLHDQALVEAIEAAISRMTTVGPHPDGKIHSYAKIDGIEKALRSGVAPKIKYYSEQLAQMLDDVLAETKISKEYNGMAINRVIDNIKEGECQVCRLPLEDFDVFIVKCCGLIVCDVCGIKGNQITKHYEYATKTTKLMGQCANCKKPVCLSTDLIFVDKNIDINSIASAKSAEIVAAPPEPVIEDEGVEKTEEKIKNPKLRALLDIINGAIPESRVDITIKIKSLLLGRCDKPQVNVTRKVVVFANYTETLKMVEAFLKENKIPFVNLHGTYKEKAKIIKQFEDNGTVLLINSQQHCAGLNIHFMTDLVFFHKIFDDNIEAQVAGRGQRIGRTCNLAIHYLTYTNESDLV